MLILKGHTNSVQALAYSPDGLTLASASDDATVRLWDMSTCRLRETLRHHSDGVIAVAFSPPGSHLGSGSYDRSIVLCDAQTGANATHFRKFPHVVTAIAFSPDGQWFLGGCDRDGGLRGYDVETRRIWHPTLVGLSIWCLGFSSDNRLAIGRGSGHVDIWDFPARRQDRSLAHAAGITALTWSSDNRWLALLSGRTVVVWDAQSYRQQWAQSRHQGHAWSLAFVPNAPYLATGGWDSTVRLWDIVTGAERAKFDFGLGRINAVAFAPNGMTGAVGGDSPDIALFDVDF